MTSNVHDILNDVSNLPRDQANMDKPCILYTDKDGNAIVKLPNPTPAPPVNDEGSISDDAGYDSDSNIPTEMPHGGTEDHRSKKNEATNSRSNLRKKLKTTTSFLQRNRTLDNWVYFFKGDKKKTEDAEKPSPSPGGEMMKDEVASKEEAVNTASDPQVSLTDSSQGVLVAEKEKASRRRYGTRPTWPKWTRKKMHNANTSSQSGEDDTDQRSRNIDVAQADADDSEDEDYEVEDIVDERVKKGRTFYFIKWKGWPSDQNTWEPMDNLNNCEAVFQRYQRKRKSSLLEQERAAKRLKLEEEEAKEKERHILREKILKKVSDKISDEDLLSLFQSKSYPKAADVKKVELDKALETLMKDGQPSDKGKKALTVVKTWLTKKKLEEKRQEQMRRLKAAQDHLNAICTGSQLFIENEVDFEDFPDTYDFINDYKAGKDVTIPDDPIIGCSCPNGKCLANKDDCCADGQAVSYAYTAGKKIRLTLGTPVIECNKRCPCPSTCPNRVVQHGRTVKLCIFRTPDGRGWGVKARANIPKDVFITEYVGEIITTKEAERRGKQYDAAGRTYLFDLDYSDAELYTVDAMKYGNEARFFNHSCTPNMDVFCVYINCLDLNLPRIALFTKRAIKKGEELTFDYCGKAKKGGKAEEEEDSGVSVPCKCGSQKCRRFFF